MQELETLLNPAAPAIDRSVPVVTQTTTFALG
jgi:hypothetical protein